MGENILEIKKIFTNKHNVYQRPLMEQKVIPHHPSISVFCGSQGSGKSTLVNNLLANPMMYKGFFDAIFLLIGSDDDMYDKLIEEKVILPIHVVKSPTPDNIQQIIDTQKFAIKNSKDISQAPKILVIMDDLANNKPLLRSKPFLELFVAGRHLNSSTWFLSQYLNLVPKNCRLQANYLFVFKSNRAEMKVLCEQFCPPDMQNDDFCKMILDVTKDSKNPDGSKKINFLMISRGVDENKKFKKNLDEYIILNDQEDPDINVNPTINEEKEEKVKELIEANSEKLVKKLNNYEKQEQPLISYKNDMVKKSNKPKYIPRRL